LPIIINLLLQNVIYLLLQNIIIERTYKRR